MIRSWMPKCVFFLYMCPIVTGFILAGCGGDGGGCGGSGTQTGQSK